MAPASLPSVEWLGASNQSAGNVVSASSRVSQRAIRGSRPARFAHGERAQRKPTVVSDA
jgi:hypothetical protein